MPKRQPALPHVWLISDPRNDALLERALTRLPRGSGLIYRHYHLAAGERHARFQALARIARAKGHMVVLADSPAMARRWRADGSYGAPSRLAGGPATLRLATAHSLREIASARRADAVLLSPVFATHSHPGARTLGPLRFRLLASRARIPVIALGGMTPHRARKLGRAPWAAIDGIAQALDS